MYMTHQKVIRSPQFQLGPELLICARTQKIEHMIVPLLWTLRADPTLLQEVMGDVAPHHRASGVKVNLHEFAKARGVVVPSCLGVAKRFQDRISC